jgi:iron complex outermembrane receptor protein
MARAALGIGATNQPRRRRTDMHAKFIAGDAALLVFTATSIGAQVTRPDTAALPKMTIEAKRSSYADTSGAFGIKQQGSILEIPQTVQAIPRALIDDRQLTTVRESIKLFSGVNSGRSATNEFVIRGFNDNGATTSFGRTGSLFAINGLRNYFGAYESDIPLVNVDRLEVLKGASGVLYGANQPGGVINLVTKQPSMTPHYAGSVSGGSWGRYRMEADATGPIMRDAGVAYRFNAGYSNSPDYRDVFWNRGLTLAPTISYEPNDRTRAILEFAYNEAAREAWYDWGVPTKDAAGTWIFERVSDQYSAHQLGDNTTLRNVLAMLSVKHQVRDGITLNVAASVSGNSNVTRGHVPSGALPDTSGNMDLAYRVVDTDYSGIFLTNYLQWETGGAFLKHRLVAGVDVMGGSGRGREISAYNTPDLPSNVAPMNVFVPVYDIRRTSDYVFNDGYTIFTKAHFTGVYAQDLMSLGGRLNVLLGLRTDRHVTRTAIGGKQLNNNPVMPNIGIVGRLTNRLSLYASHTEGFEPQLTQDPAVGGPFDPLISKQWEGGAKALWRDGALTTTASLYRITREHELMSAGDAANPRKLVQVGRTQSDGVELDLAGRITTSWSMTANYAHNFARAVAAADPRSVGRRLPNAPAAMAAFWSRYDIDRGALRGLGLGGGVSHVGKRLGAFQYTEYEGYTLLDAALYYRVNDVALSLNANNLTDKRYLTGIWSDFYAQRGMPRNLMVKAGFAY